MRRKELIKRRHLNRILYTLQRAYGVDGQLYKTTVGAANYVSGNKGVSRTMYNVQMITFTVSESRKFEYDLGYLAANKNFTYGGFYEPGDRFAIIDLSRNPDLSIDMKDYIVYDEDRYDMQRIEPLDTINGWLLHIRKTKDNKRYAIHETYIYDHLDISEEITNGV